MVLDLPCQSFSTVWAGGHSHNIVVRGTAVGNIQTESLLMTQKPEILVV